MPKRWLSLLLCCTAALALPFPAPEEVDSEDSRRVLGSSVVTSVSVIMDLGNGTKKYFADAAGRPVPKPTAAAMVGSPAGLLNPDRYEFYTFDEAGDLVKRLMTLEEIQSMIANGESDIGEPGRPNYYHQNLPPDSGEPSPAASSTVTDKVVEEAEATDIGELSSSVPGVHAVVVSVQNVLKGELEASKNKISSPKPVPPHSPSSTISTSDSSSSWDMLLPGIMGNSGSAANVANQTTFSTSSPVPSTTKEQTTMTQTLSSSTSIPTKISSASTESVTTATSQIFDKISTFTAAKKPLSPVISDSIAGEDTSSSLNIHSKLPPAPLSSQASSSPSSTHPSPSTIISSSKPFSPSPSTSPPAPFSLPTTLSTSHAPSSLPPTFSRPTSLKPSSILSSSSPILTSSSPIPTSSSSVPTSSSSVAPLSPQKSSSSSPITPPSSVLPTSPSTITSSSTISSLQLISSSSSQIISSLLPSTTLQSSVFPSSTPLKIPSLGFSPLHASSATQEMNSPMQPSSVSSPSTVLPASLPQKLPLSSTASVTQSPAPQSSASESSNFSMIENPANSSLKIKDTLNVNQEIPLDLHDFNKISSSTLTTVSQITSTTRTPTRTTYLPLTTSKTSSVSNTDAETVDTNPALSLSVSSSNEYFNKIPVNNKNISTPLPSLSHSSATVKFTTSKPVTSTLSESSSIKPQYSTHKPIEHTMVMISSSESTNHDDFGAAQQFFGLFKPNNQMKKNTTNSFSTTSVFTKPTPEKLSSSSTTTKVTNKPITTVSSSASFAVSTTTTRIPPKKNETQPQNPSRKPLPSLTSVQNKNPIKPLRTTPSIKVTTQPPRTSVTASVVRTSTFKPTDITTSLPSSTIISNENPDMSSIELLKTTAQKIKLSTTAQPPVQTTTQNNDVENLLINEASGFVPTKLESPFGALPLPSTANGNLDVPPELAASLLGVLSQVADVEGAPTTIDYGESGLFIFSSSATTTHRSNTEDINSTENISTLVPTNKADDNRINSRITTIDSSNIATEATKTISHSPAVDMLSTNKLTTNRGEITQQDIITTELVTDVTTSQPFSNLKVKETENEKTAESSSIESTNIVHEQAATETIEKEAITSTKATTLSSGNKLKVDSNNMNLQSQNKLTVDKESKEPNKKVENTVNEKKEDEKLKEKNTISTNAEILTGASSNNEALKTSLEGLNKKPSEDEIVASVLEEMDKIFVSKSVTTIQPMEDTTTVKEITEQRETTAFNIETTTTSGVSDITTEQQSPNTRRNDIQSGNEAEISEASASNIKIKLGLEETSTTTERAEIKTTEPVPSTVQDITEYATTEISVKRIELTTAVTDSFTEMDVTETSTLVTKDNAETSTVMLTKYKKDDNEVAEESMQGNLTLIPAAQLTNSNISSENVLSTLKNTLNDDLGSTSTVNQETTTQAEDETTKFSTEEEESNSDGNKPTDASVSTEISKETELKVGSIVPDGKERIEQSSQTKVKIDVSDINHETFGLKTRPLDSENTMKPEEFFTEEITTEATFKYEPEITTEIKYVYEKDISTTNSEEESVSTTYASVKDEENIERTTILPHVQGSETKLNNNIVLNNFTKTPFKNESIVNIQNSHLNSNVSSTTDSIEGGTTVKEPEITKFTAINTSWTKIPSIPSSHSDTNKLADKIAVASTLRPIALTSRVTTTTEAASTPVEILKVSGLNEEKVKDTKIKAKPQELQRPQTYVTVDLEPAPQENLGLEATSANLEEDVRRFSELCNELAFRLWASVTAKGMTTSRSLIMSPFAATSLLAMVFLGARGPTSGQMNDILRLDDMVTFNPHQVFRNVTEAVAMSKNQGISTAAFVRQLYSDRTKGKLLEFYKERVQQFYDGHVEEVNFNAIGDLVRRRTNLLIKRQTRGKVPEYLRGSNILLRPPLAVFSANILQTDCSQASTYGRDGEMYFTVMPAMRQRRLVPVPAVVWFNGFLAGYDPVLDATAVSIGNDDSLVSLVMVLPGQQGQQAPGDGLQRLEQRLIETSYRRGAWSRLLRSLLPRPGLELQIPRFSHRSLLNVTAPLQRMGLKDLFSAEHADLRGINGLANDLHLSDIVQVNTFSTCAEESIGSRHHVEVYPTSPQRSGREELDEDPKKGTTIYEDMADLGLSSVPLALRPRQARLPDAPRLRFDKAFIYFVRHNPTGLILYMGRFNPRLLH